MQKPSRSPAPPPPDATRRYDNAAREQRRSRCRADALIRRFEESASQQYQAQKIGGFVLFTSDRKKLSWRGCSKLRTLLHYRYRDHATLR